MAGVPEVRDRARHPAHLRPAGTGKLSGSPFRPRGEFACEVCRLWAPVLADAGLSVRGDRGSVAQRASVASHLTDLWCG